MTTVTLTLQAPETAVSHPQLRISPPPCVTTAAAGPAKPAPPPLLLPPRSPQGVRYSSDAGGTAHYRFAFPAAHSVVVAGVHVWPLAAAASGTFAKAGAGADYRLTPTTVVGVSGAATLSRNAEGVWVGSTCAAVGLHCVVLLVDGAPVLTPHLPIGYLYGVHEANFIDAPPATPRLCPYVMRASVEHGVVTHNFITSYTMDAEEEVLVYLPPSYHKASSATRRYPVLYLLHDDRGTHVMNCVHLGKANVIADNLIAESRTPEFILVMVGNRGGRGADGEPLLASEVAQLCDDLTEDIVPYIDHRYRTLADRDNRAIAGLSMGSMQASRLCMTRHDLFAYAGIFSGFLRTSWSGIGSAADDHIDALRRDPAAFQAAMRVFFRCMGDADVHRPVFEADDALLAELGVACERRLYAGPHSWHVWRQAAADFLPMLFKEPQYER